MDIFSNSLRWRERQRVLELVSADATGLEFAEAADEYKRDREIIIAAVSQNGHALQYAAEECQRDRETVLAAVESNHFALEYAADRFLEDVTFASEARKQFYFFKVYAATGQSCTIALSRFNGKEFLLRKACQKLGVPRAGTQLRFGSDTVPDKTTVSDWPGAPYLGEVVEYLLVRYQA
mmetsp:Transcript_71280/g.133332  ORF Transcript_71280/g.133332 Transcript_71280/m.133332 type:complete len:179 (-) Transcript_71280:104-640(-)